MDLIAPFLQHLQSQQYSENSLQSHRLDLRRFLAWLEPEEGSSPLPRLKHLALEQLEAYQEDLGQHYKQRTVARHLSSLKLFLDFWVSQGSIPLNPVHQLRFPEIVPEPLEMLTLWEVQALLEAPSLDHYLGLRDRTMLELLYACGLKVSELLGLNVGSLFLDLGFIKVYRKQVRMVPLLPRTSELLQRYLSEAREGRLLSTDDPCLFPGRNGTRMSRMGFWAMVRKHAQRAGIEKPLNPRMLRHSFAMHLLQNGMDLTDIRDLFGYVSLDATLQYAHVNRPDFEEEYHRYHPRGEHYQKQGEP